MRILMSSRNAWPCCSPMSQSDKLWEGTDGTSSGPLSMRRRVRQNLGYIVSGVYGEGTMGGLGRRARSQWTQRERDHAQAHRADPGADRRAGGKQCRAWPGVVSPIRLQARRGCGRPAGRRACGALVVSLPTRGHRRLPAGGGAATANCTSAVAATLLVLLRQSPGLLPVCPTVPWGVEAGAGHTSTITKGRIETWVSHGSCCWPC